jgi:hypothetical protein
VNVAANDMGGANKSESPDERYRLNYMTCDRCELRCMIHKFHWSDKERLTIKRLHKKLSKATGYDDQQECVQ